MLCETIQKISEIPVGKLGMQEVIELLEMYNERGYRANIKSKKGAVMLQIHRVSYQNN